MAELLSSSSGRPQDAVNFQSQQAVRDVEDAEWTTGVGLQISYSACSSLQPCSLPSKIVRCALSPAMAACATAASSMVFVREVCLNVMWPPKVQEALITLHSPNVLEAGLLDGQRHVAAAHHAGVPRGRDFDGLRRSRERRKQQSYRGRWSEESVWDTCRISYAVRISEFATLHSSIAWLGE